MLSAKDYQSGKMITVFSVSEGLVNIAVLDDLDKPKFTYAKEILTFGHFSVAVKGSFFYLLERCEIVDTFEKIKLSGQKFAEAINLLTVCKEVAQFNDPDAPLLLRLMGALKILNYQKLQPNIVLAKFMTDLFAAFAQNANVEQCFACQGKIENSALFSLTANQFFCSNCGAENAVTFSKLNLTTLRILTQTDYARLNNLKLQKIDEFLELMLQIFRFKVSARFKFYCQ